MGAKSPKTSDRRVQRTRRTLRQALVSLLLERGWDAVNVQDICERADVGRSTFYSHFADKEDLLVGGFDDLRKGLRQQLASVEGGDRLLPFAQGLIEHAWEQQRLFRALVGRRSGQVVLRRFRELVIDLVREDLAAFDIEEERREVSVRFVAGAFLEVLTWWLESARGAMGPEEVERVFVGMARPVLISSQRR